MIIKIVAIIAGLILANWLVWHLIGIIAGVVWLLFLTACVAGLAYFIYTYFQSKQSAQPGKTKYLVWDTHNSTVQLFHIEPALEDIVQGASEPGLFLQSGQAEELPNSTEVKVLEDKGGMAVKVKVVDGNQKQKVGWVARTLLVRSK